MPIRRLKYADNCPELGVRSLSPEIEVSIQSFRVYCERVVRKSGNKAPQLASSTCPKYCLKYVRCCSYRGSQMCSVTSSRMSSVASTPAVRSRRNSTTTYSSSLGLAKMLNERGIKAVTPSTLPTPMFTPTATPANSPDHSPNGSPEHSRSPSPSPSSSTYSPLGLPGEIMSVPLVNKFVENIGLKNYKYY